MSSRCILKILHEMLQVIILDLMRDFFLRVTYIIFKQRVEYFQYLTAMNVIFYLSRALYREKRAKRRETRGKKRERKSPKWGVDSLYGIFLPKLQQTDVALIGLYTRQLPKNDMLVIE